MDHLVLEISPEKRAYFDSQIMLGLDRFLIGEEEYQLLLDGTIFEWLFTPEGTVNGVELMLNKKDFDDLGIPSSLKLDGWIRKHSPAVFWFSDRLEGMPRWLQDWESYIYKTSLGRYLVALRTHMLSDQETEALKATILAGRNLYQ